MLTTLSLVLVIFSVMLWAIILLLPWRPWLTHEILDADTQIEQALDDVTVVIPARNEASVIQNTLRSVISQDEHLKVIFVDDDSTDATVARAKQVATANVSLILGESLTEGWSGKLWALQQGSERVKTKYTLFLDADIELDPGLIKSLLAKLQQDNLQFVSLMAAPPLTNFWEKLLMPAFIYYFKLLYPFSLSNSASKHVAAAAGGCILFETQILKAIGGMQVMRGAIIDDCTFALNVKKSGYRTWIGLTHSVRSVRLYKGVSEIWNMVARTAFTQLFYSITLLIGVSLLMIVAYWVPVMGLFDNNLEVVFGSVTAWALMLLTYIPILRFYSMPLIWSIFLPVIGTLFLCMTWTSALRYWRGERSRWKDRVYTNV